MTCPRPTKPCNEYMCGSMIDGYCYSGVTMSDKTSYSDGYNDAIEDFYTEIKKHVDCQLDEIKNKLLRR